MQPSKMPEQSNDYRIIVFGAGSVGKSLIPAAVKVAIC